MVCIKYHAITTPGMPSVLITTASSAYCDADWAGDIVDCKSFSGYLFSFAGRPILWISKGQPYVSTSSTETEYVALSDAAKQALDMQTLLSSLNHFCSVSLNRREREILFGI